MNYVYFLTIFLAGAVGAFIRLCFDDGKILLPRRVTDGVALGFFSSVLIGGFVGLVVDGSLLTAAMAGFVGHTILEKLLPDMKIVEVVPKGEPESGSEIAPK
jgi:hypothetical protein